MHILENKEMSCVMRYKFNWDPNFMGVSSSEAPPYLLLWHFSENKSSNRTLFSRVLKRQRPNMQQCLKIDFGYFLRKSACFEKIAQKCARTLF